MVALKPWVRKALGAEVWGKQERRGGIETPRRPIAPMGKTQKQERRGGIETMPNSLSIGMNLNGSRNAVVALKPTHPCSRTARAVSKQERRGGIETRGPGAGGLERSAGSRNAVVALKPTGYEVRFPGELTGSRNAVVALKPWGSPRPRSRCAPEAGTPWWH